MWIDEVDMKYKVKDVSLSWPYEDGLQVHVMN